MPGLSSARTLFCPLMLRIRRAQTAADFEQAAQLFHDYVERLEFDLDFQDIEDELETLPGPYAAPEGAILLADVDDEPVGVVAVQPLDEDGVCEMKRLYVKPEHRGQGIGRALCTRLLTVAQALNYHTMRLDTVASMGAARALYESLGFDERSAYYDNPLDDVVYMERAL